MEGGGSGGRTRCHASSCSRRRAGGGPGAPRGPAAADANLCPRHSVGLGAVGVAGAAVPGSPGIVAAMLGFGAAFASTVE